VSDHVSSATIRLLVVDDHPVVVDGLAMLLRTDPAIEIVGSAATAREAAVLARETQPDVALLDLRLPDALGVDAIGILRAAVPALRIILFTAYAQHAGLSAAMEAGIDGCLLKDAGVPDVVDAIHRVMAGERVFDERINNSPAPHAGARLPGIGLSRREYEVLRLAATGRTNVEIAAELGLMPTTTKGYLQSVMQKLGARNRVEAICRAREATLL
jgi:DNA-binding NarL/FixJ family response regulator